jgi:hypothetical protein
VPAAAVIPAPIAYIKVVAVKKLVVGLVSHAVGSSPVDVTARSKLNSGTSSRWIARSGRTRGRAFNPRGARTRSARAPTAGPRARAVSRPPSAAPLVGRAVAASRPRVSAVSRRRGAFVAPVCVGVRRGRRPLSPGAGSILLVSVLLIECLDGPARLL